VFLFRELAAQLEASPSPLRLLLLPQPGQRLSVQLLKRRGPVLARPLLIDLPQPIEALRPGRAGATVAAAGRSPRPVPDGASLLSTAHTRPSSRVPGGDAQPDPAWPGRSH
jgi:hypothetical protein